MIGCLPLSHHERFQDLLLASFEEPSLLRSLICNFRRGYYWWTTLLLIPIGSWHSRAKCVNHLRQARISLTRRSALRYQVDYPLRILLFEASYLSNSDIDTSQNTCLWSWICSQMSAVLHNAKDEINTTRRNKVKEVWLVRFILWFFFRELPHPSKVAEFNGDKKSLFPLPLLSHFLHLVLKPLSFLYFTCCIQKSFLYLTVLSFHETVSDFSYPGIAETNTITSRQKILLTVVFRRQKNFVTNLAKNTQLHVLTPLCGFDSLISTLLVHPSVLPCQMYAKLCVSLWLVFVDLMWHFIKWF